MTGEEFRAWRQRHRWSQAKAGRVFGVTQHAVHYWEDNINGIPPLVQRLIALMDASPTVQRKLVDMADEEMKAVGVLIRGEN